VGAKLEQLHAQTRPIPDEHNAHPVSFDGPVLWPSTVGTRETLGLPFDDVCAKRAFQENIHPLDEPWRKLYPIVACWESGLLSK
jgi:hypothetical protein